MVCDKCQSKLNRVICPDVAKKPMGKAGVGAAAGAAGAAEEAKEESKLSQGAYALAMKAQTSRSSLAKIVAVSLTDYCCHFFLGKVPLYKRKLQQQ